jgi:hypothetical protein
MKTYYDPTPEEIKIASRMIKKSLKIPGLRTIDDERVFMENLLVQRLNYMLITYAIFISGAFTVDKVYERCIIFTFGILIIGFMATTVQRAHRKHHFIMRLLYESKIEIKKYKDVKNEYLDHPVKFINDKINDKEQKSTYLGRSVSTIVGRWIPIFCVFSLIVGALFYLYQTLKTYLNI